MEQLPHSVKLIISSNLKDKGWDLTELLLAIKNKLYARENSKVEKEPQLPFSGAPLHANQKSNHSNLSSAVCKENHFSDKCPKVTDIAIRRNIFVILGVVLCVLDQDIKLQNAQARKRVIIAKNDIILFYVSKEKREFRQIYQLKKILPFYYKLLWFV